MDVDLQANQVCDTKAADNFKRGLKLKCWLCLILFFVLWTTYCISNIMLRVAGDQLLGADAPGMPLVMNVSPTTALLLWKPPTNPPSPVQNYRIQTRIGRGSEWDQPEITTDNNDTSYKVSGLIPRTVCAFRVAANYENGEGPWSTEASPIRTPREYASKLDKPHKLRGFVEPLDLYQGHPNWKTKDVELGDRVRSGYHPRKIHHGFRGDTGQSSTEPNEPLGTMMFLLVVAAGAVSLLLLYGFCYWICCSRKCPPYAIERESQESSDALRVNIPGRPANTQNMRMPIIEDTFFDQSTSF